MLADMLAAALASVSAERCLPAHLPAEPRGRRLVLAVGKAAAAMAKVAMREARSTTRAIILVPYRHALPPGDFPEGTIILEAGHPLPDEHGLEAARRICDAVRALGPEDQLLALISGGGSALLALPADGVSLDDKRSLTRELLYCGATISEINCVRTHLSRIKGGRLAAMAHPAEVVTLAFSDIPGDDPALIASGPTVPDRTTLADARRVLERYGISMADHINAVLRDERSATPQPDAGDIAAGRTRIVARSRMALEAAGEIARAAGYMPVYLGDDLEGNATEIGTVHAALALHHQRKGGRWALLSGGETTVFVRNPDGKGGRNSEYALSLALALGQAEGISALAFDTDGLDGVGGHGGAIIDWTTLARARFAGLSPSRMLQGNDSFGFFDALGDLVHTGPTLTNVNDLRVVLVDADQVSH
ncbi:glycerate kinase [Sphingomonas sp. DBB INV C78]|uniref:glycerate kinase type-2 family protein n=1 Tax=Sphingomonas sp. DBB INV C78 TaxID=3349434 RepID=UPI0036D41A54